MPALPPALRFRWSGPRDAVVERRYYLNAQPGDAWTALVADENASRLYPELTLGPAESTWPAAGSSRLARLAVGLLREPVLLESLEARPGVSFHFRIVGLDVIGEFGWALEPLAGGTRVVHTAMMLPVDRWAAALARLTRRSPGERVEDHLVALKLIVERTAEGTIATP
jgi:hypothetical protein